MRATTLQVLARGLALLSLLLGAGSILAVLFHGPALLFGALALGLATTAGTVHKRSRLAPAVFLVDLACVLTATILHFTVAA
jgi:hypothetical protein